MPLAVERFRRCIRRQQRLFALSRSNPSGWPRDRTPKPRLIVSTTLTRPVVEPGGHSTGLRLDPMGHRRRPALAVGSLALVIACVAVFVSVYLKAGHQVEVLAVERTVPQGQVLVSSDLTVVRLSMAAGVDTVPASEASAVVGRRAAERLDAGTLITTNDVVTNYAPPAGESIVGVAAKEGQLPASGVAPGETVDVILTGSPGVQDSSGISDPNTAQGNDSSTVTPGEEASSAAIVLVPDATVLEATTPSLSSGSDVVDVSLLTPVTMAPLVANASAAGQVALIVVRCV